MLSPEGLQGALGTITALEMASAGLKEGITETYSVPNVDIATMKVTAVTLRNAANFLDRIAADEARKRAASN